MMLVPLLGVTLFNYRMKLKKQALLLIIVSTAISVVSVGQFASAQFSINSGQSCKSIGQIRDYQGQRFICRRVNAKAGSSSGPYLIWFKISSPKTTTKPTTTTQVVTTTSTSSTTPLPLSCAKGGECRVGDIGAGGGLVFYVSSSAQLWGRYMEAAPNRWNGQWADLPHSSGCYGLSIPDASAVGLGSGKQNTELIVSACSESNIAARVAYDLILNGKTDWHLPSRDELNAMYPHRVAIGINIAADNQPYASSSFPNATTFWGQLFTDDTRLGNKAGQQFRPQRTSPYNYYVRPIRYGNFGS